MRALAELLNSTAYVRDGGTLSHSCSAAMKLRRPRFALKKEKLGSTPILSNPIEYISFESYSIVYLLLGSALGLLLHWVCRQRAKCRRVNKTKATLKAFSIQEELPRDKLSLELHLTGDFGTSGGVRRGVYGNSPTGQDVAAKIFKNRETVEKVAEVYQLLRTQQSTIVELIGIIGGLDAAEDQASYCVLTPWHVRGSLYDHLRVKTLSYSQLLYLAESISSGLKFLHSEGIMTENGTHKPPMAHRNLKSKNILLKDNKTACIADLDLVAIFDTGRETAEDGSRAGSLLYMSPEELAGALSWNQKGLQAADMYATAFVLWEMLSRTAISDESSEYKAPLLERVGPRPTLVQMKDSVVMRHIRPTIKEAWRRDERFAAYITILEECWDRDPEVRWSASRVHERLRRLVAFVESIASNRTILSST